MSGTELTPYEHIAQLAHSYLEQAKDSQAHAGHSLLTSLHASIKNLSEGLYSKDIHFILELIQNAEDNHYGDGVVPELTFELLNVDPTNSSNTDGALLVVNNETGFLPEQIDAICRIGQTTKTEKRSGYIGEKGIGFKSVFLVTQRPHIFSNGYQFHFDKNQDPKAGFGYIFPYWVSEPPAILAEHSNNTSILLPLEASKRSEVQAQLQATAPETILFLKNLKGLTLNIENNDSITIYRNDETKPRIQLIVNRAIKQYWLAEQDIEVPVNLYEGKRLGIKERPIHIAFPLSGGLSSHSVFAFLPTEEQSGLPFLVNADFILTASRESIQIDLPWNQWLRDQFDGLFIASFKNLIRQKEYRFAAYQYIPLPEIITHPFFAQVAKSICEELSDEPVIRTFHGNRLVEPSVARFANKNFRALIASAKGAIPAQLRLTPLVHPELESYRDQLSAIGVTTLTHNEILQCLDDNAWLDRQSLKWFVTLYAYLKSHSWERLYPARIRHIVPLEDGTRTSSEWGNVYFPTPDAEELKALQAQHNATHTAQFMHPRLYAYLQENTELLNWVEQKLRVRYFTPAQYCESLLQTFKHHWDSLKPDQLVQITRYIRDHRSELSKQLWDRLRSLLPVLLDTGNIVEAQEWSDVRPLVMPVALNPNGGWPDAFPNTEDRPGWHVISNLYLQGEDETAKSVWSVFFEELGATNVPIPLRQWRSGIGMAPLHSTTRYEYRQVRETEGYFLKDVRAPQWLKDYHEGEKPVRSVKTRANAMLQWLELIPDYEFPFPATYDYFYRSHRTKQLSSELTCYLRDSAWLPTTKGLKKPAEAFLNRPEIRELFGESLAYVLSPIGEDVAHYLGVQRSATVEQIKAYLSELAASPATNADIGLVTKIYRFLSDRWNSALREFFNTNAVILVRKPTPRWVKASEAIWPDNSAVFGSLYAYLEVEYPVSLKDFWIGQVGIPAKVEDRIYADAWEKWSAKNDSKAEDVERALEQLFIELRRIATKPPLENWWSEFRKNAKVWAQSDRWVKANQTYVPDDPDLRKLFEPTGAEFVWRPTKDSFAENTILYRALGVRSIVESVKVSVEQVLESSDQEDELLLRSEVKRAICLFLANRYPELFAALRASNVLANLLQTKEILVNLLSVRYSLPPHHEIVQNDEASLFWDEPSCRLYRLKSHNNDDQKVDLPITLARKLMSGKNYANLADFIGRIVTASDNMIRRILYKEQLEFTESDHLWVESLLESERVSLAEPEEEMITPETSPEPSAEARHESSATTDPAHRDRQTGQQQTTGTNPRDEKREGHASPKAANPTANGSSSHTNSRPSPVDAPISRPRKVTYVETDSSIKEDDIVDPGTQEQKRQKLHQLEQEAIAWVLAYEEGEGRKAVNLNITNPNHEGWDIDSVQEEFIQDTAGVTHVQNRQVRHIEVKAKEGAWDDWGIGLTSAQHRAAQEHKSDYYLYVVEFALNPARRTLHIFRNPVSDIAEYRFDEKWKLLATELPVSDELEPLLA